MTRPTVALSSTAYGGTTAICDGERLIGVCAQARVTRVRRENAPPGWPDAALDLMLGRLGLERGDIARYAIAEPGEYRSPAMATPAAPQTHLDHHLAHAATAYLTSPFTAAAIVVCDEDAPGLSVWTGQGPAIARVDWPAGGLGFADAWAQLAAMAGLTGRRALQRFDTLARLTPDADAARFRTMFAAAEDGVTLDPALPAAVRAALDAPRRGAGALAEVIGQAEVVAALQSCLGDVLLDLLARVRARLGVEHLCLGGSLFQNSALVTRAKSAGVFADVFVPIDPGNGGVAVGAALHAAGAAPYRASPFLGPSYGAEEIKRELDNCKLQYAWESDERLVQIAARALTQGLLVGWFDGAMEWGPRALGARSILASPFSPYVLENLNRFLKQREAWHGYGLSAFASSVQEHFAGPAQAPFMESDYRPRDAERFRAVLPVPGAAMRVQTVDDAAPPRFRRLLEVFGESEAPPALVNTSFNGFHEPIVCSPRDAVRVFYGSGLDVLVMPPFLLRK